MSAEDMLSAEMLQKMIKAMDTDGDGKCSKAEFKTPYLTIKGSLPDAEYDKLWDKIDSDRSGDVSVKELAKYYGFTVDASGNVIQDDEMNDDAILEALRMASELSVDVPAARSSQKKVSNSQEQVNVKLINPKTTPAESPERQLLEECHMGMSPEKVEALADVLAEKTLSVRIANEENKMPLHLLARVGDRFESVIRKLLDMGGEARKDINYQDKFMKTPLHYAAEHKQKKLLRILLDRGADPLKETEKGWTVLHWAAWANVSENVEMILKHERVQPKLKQLIDARSIDSQTALMVASMNSTDGAVVTKLLEHGANPDTADNAGNNRIKLAQKAGRRKSREILEAFNPK